LQPFKSSFEEFIMRPVLEYNATTLVIQSGAWYNNLKLGTHHAVEGPVSPTEVYQQMLRELALVLGKLVKRGVKVYWLDLPPMPTDQPHSKKYSWASFVKYNARAESLLQQSGVVYLGTDRAIRPRKEKDPNITSANMPGGDMVHWCNPGEYTAPRMFVETLMHLMATATHQPV
jgi:hypothetical protein